MKKTDTVAKTYSYLWDKEKKGNILPDSHHYNKLQGVVPFSIVSGFRGIDAGCGNGYDLRLMALKYPNVNFIGVDISNGIFNAKENCRGLKNVHFVKGSLLNLPFKSRVFDFAYSFGAIHHTPNPRACFSELRNALNKESYLTVYLYEKHENSPTKYLSLMVVKAIRFISAKMPKNILYAFCILFSPIIFLLFSLPAKIFRLSKKTEKFADKIPFNFAKDPFSLARDLYDRFGAPIEHRYSRQEMIDLFKNASFKNIDVTKLKDTAGWVAWGKSE